MLTKTNIQSCLCFSMCEGLQREASSRNPKTVTENRPGRTSKDFKTSESKEPRTTEETLVDDSAESGIAQGCTERLQTGK